jgi:hypothetical protein
MGYFEREIIEIAFHGKKKKTAGFDRNPTGRGMRLPSAAFASQSLVACTAGAAGLTVRAGRT